MQIIFIFCTEIIHILTYNVSFSFFQVPLVLIMGQMVRKLPVEVMMVS